jgi:hypothetical protein
MQPSIWGKLLQDVVDRGICKNATDDPELRKQIIKAKEDMGRFLELVRPGSALFSNGIWKVGAFKKLKL